MNGRLLGGLLAVAAVVAVGLLLRAGQRDAGAPAPGYPPPPLPGPDDEPTAPEADPGGVEVAAVTSDGAALVPDAHAVRLVPPPEEGEGWKAGESVMGRNRRGDAAMAMSWHAADFTGARVVRGGADEGPWRLEALGRDGEYTAFGFETRDGAEAALRLFEARGVIRLGADEDGRPLPPSPEQFAEARRVYLETEQALALEPDDEDPSPA